MQAPLRPKLERPLKEKMLSAPHPLVAGLHAAAGAPPSTPAGVRLAGPYSGRFGSTGTPLWDLITRDYSIRLKGTRAFNENMVTW